MLSPAVMVESGVATWATTGGKFEGTSVMLKDVFAGTNIFQRIHKIVAWELTTSPFGSV